MRRGYEQPVSPYVPRSYGAGNVEMGNQGITLAGRAPDSRQSRPAAYESSQIDEAREPSSQKPSATRRQPTQPPEKQEHLPYQQQQTNLHWQEPLQMESSRSQHRVNLVNQPQRDALHFRSRPSLLHRNLVGHRRHPRERNLQPTYPGKIRMADSWREGHQMLALELRLRHR
jgi:hypothetical protein